MIDIILIGFDLRLAPGLPNPDWTAERREGYLLNPAIPIPLSVDPVTWPRPITLGGDGPLGLWLDLIGFEATAEQSSQPGTRIAIGIAFQPTDGDTQLYLATSVAPCRPVKPDVGWPFLGYDVADGALTSAVSNCGFVPSLDDVAALRAEWTPRLNTHGLFVDWDHAAAFRKESEARIPEHAPFFTFGLWLVSKRSQLGAG